MASIYNGKTPQPFCVADSDLRDVWVYVAGAIGIARHAEVVDCIECLATEKEGDTLIVMLTRDLSEADKQRFREAWFVLMADSEYGGFNPDVKFPLVAKGAGCKLEAEVRAKRDGFHAGTDGKPMVSPHPDGSDLDEAWLAGWREGAFYQRNDGAVQ